MQVNSISSNLTAFQGRNKNKAENGGAKALASYLVPGLGQACDGRKKEAAGFFGGVTGLYAASMLSSAILVPQALKNIMLYTLDSDYSLAALKAKVAETDVDFAAVKETFKEGLPKISEEAEGVKVISKLKTEMKALLESVNSPEELEGAIKAANKNIAVKALVPLGLALAAGTLYLVNIVDAYKGGSKKSVEKY